MATAQPALPRAGRSRQSWLPARQGFVGLFEKRPHAPPGLPQQSTGLTTTGQTTTAFRRFSSMRPPGPRAGRPHEGGAKMVAGGGVSRPNPSLRWDKLSGGVNNQQTRRLAGVRFVLPPAFYPMLALAIPTSAGKLEITGSSVYVPGIGCGYWRGRLVGRTRGSIVTPRKAVSGARATSLGPVLPGTRGRNSCSLREANCLYKLRPCSDAHPSRPFGDVHKV